MAPARAMRSCSPRACRSTRVHAMHDPTEGGLATACWELAQAAAVGVRVSREQIPVLSEGRVLCEAFGLDPLGTIASGSLLLAVDPADADGVIAACRGAGIACAAIGKVTPAADGVTLVSAGIARPMTRSPRCSRQPDMRQEGVCRKRGEAPLRV